MKTYSEIMREKQQKRLAEQQSAEKHLAEQQSADDTSEQSSKPRKKFTPIVFDDSETNRPRTKNDNDVKVATTKRKFTPVVFDLSDKKEEAKKSEKVKRFKPIVFDDTPSSDKTKTSPSQQQQQQHEAVKRRSISKDDTGEPRTGISSPIVLYHQHVRVTNVNKTFMYHLCMFRPLM